MKMAMMMMMIMMKMITVNFQKICPRLEPGSGGAQTGSLVLVSKTVMALEPLLAKTQRVIIQIRCILFHGLLGVIFFFHLLVVN